MNYFMRFSFPTLSLCDPEGIRTPIIRAEI